MKNTVLIIPSAFIMLLITVSSGCKKDPSVTLPVLNNTTLINITQSAAVCTDSINSAGDANITEKGFCWNTISNPLITDHKVAVYTDSAGFRASLTGLSPNISYYVRSYAINSKGISYGTEQTFTLWLNIPGPSITDIQGNTYQSVKIGTQVWMSENLRSTMYRNGDLISTTIPDTLDISSEIYPNYHWTYNGNTGNLSAFGRLYTWNTVTDERNIAPPGWHIPTDAEWAILRNYLGGTRMAGNKLKEAGTQHWKSPNTGATNESGFSALPSGYRLANGPFLNISFLAYWWSATPCTGCADHSGMVWYIDNTLNLFEYGYDQASSGFAVRCIKD